MEYLISQCTKSVFFLCLFLFYFHALRYSVYIGELPDNFAVLIKFTQTSPSDTIKFIVGLYQHVIKDRCNCVINVE